MQRARSRHSSNTELGPLSAGRWYRPTAPLAGRETSLDTALRPDGRLKARHKRKQVVCHRHTDLSGTVRLLQGGLVDIVIGPHIPRQQRSLFFKLNVFTNLGSMSSL